MSNEPKDQIAHVEDAEMTIDGFKTELTNEARLGDQEETNMTLMEGIRKYPKAVFWSALLSTALIMEGFDMALIGSLIALPQFNKDFGVYLDGTWQIPARWQTGLSNGSSSGQVIGLLISGMVADKVGSRYMMIGALMLSVGFIFILFFCRSIQMLLGGEILLGLVWGALQTVTNAYAAEVCPVVLRAYLTTYVNMCWLFGNLIAAGTLRGVDSMNSKWEYKVGFALQWIWPVPLSIGIFFAPESPWWLVRKNRPEAAMKSLKRLTNHATEEELQNKLANIIYTTRIENEIRQGTTYFDCFKGTDLRRTEICMITYLTQSICGSLLLGKSTYFMEQAGLSSSYSFDLSIVQYVLGIAACVCCWYLMKLFGRRRLYLFGLISLGSILLIMGILGSVKQSSTVSWVIGIMLLVEMFCYDLSIGPLVYALCSELPSAKLRQKTIVLSRASYMIGLIICNCFSPYQLNPQAWNWGAKVGYFWLGLDIICIIYIYFRLPEPKGRSYAELDLLFESKVPARKFRKTKVDPFSMAQVDEIFHHQENKEQSGL